MGQVSLRKVNDYVLSFVYVRPEVYIVLIFCLVRVFYHEFFVLVDAAAVLWELGLVLVLNLSLRLVYKSESLHYLDGNEGCLELLLDSFYIHFRLWFVF